MQSITYLQSGEFFQLYVYLIIFSAMKSPSTHEATCSQVFNNHFVILYRCFAVSVQYRTLNHVATIK